MQNVVRQAVSQFTLLEGREIVKQTGCMVDGSGFGGGDRDLASGIWRIDESEKFKMPI